MKRIRSLGALILGLCLFGMGFSPALTEASETASVRLFSQKADCPVEPHDNLYVMTRDSTGVSFVQDTTDAAVEPTPPTSGNWINSDVNNDGRLDVGIRDPGGSKYNSEYRLYVACGDGRYVRVLSERAYEFEFIGPDSSTAPDRPGITTPYVKTASGQRWRQLIQKARGKHVVPNRPSITAVSRIYRMYEHLGRYTAVPGSAWYMETVPYRKSVLEQVERLPPECPTGQHPPKVIGNEQAGTVLWRGNLNRDDHTDLIVRNDTSEKENGEYSFTVYSGCEKMWYTPVFTGSALNVKVDDNLENHERWKSISVTKYENNNLQEFTLDHNHLKYKRE